MLSGHLPLSMLEIVMRYFSICLAAVTTPAKNMGTRYDAVVKLDLLLVTTSLVYILNHLMARETAHHSLIEIVMISQLKKERTCLLTRRMETSQ
jgi:hypothetical protein